MARWRSLASDAGILRKKQPEKPEDLLVFGYSCKLFRDDEKALYIDQGKHLISWMGDEKLKIDRYDCRGALSELNSCEASREGYDAMRWLGLSEAERRIEQLCDEERYYSLYANEEEEELYKEEERKRLQQKSNEFQYSYGSGEREEGPQPKVEEVQGAAERPFTPPPELDVPADITIPKTTKENARIEKTAHFVHQHGAQMEILIKAKQSDNPQFGFLNQDNPLYKYYRHVLMAIKGGRYTVQALETDAEQKKEEQSEQETNEDTYLHPSLLSTLSPAATTTTTIIHSGQDVQQQPPLPTVAYKRSADCTYSQLVNRIQARQLKQEEPTTATATTTNNYEQQQQQYYQYYYATQQQQYYEYYKQMMQYQGGEFSMENLQTQMLNSFKEQNLDSNQYLAFYMQYMQQQSSNPYAQIVTNVTENISKVAEKPETKKPLLSLAQNYGSDSDETTSDEERIIVRVPPGETRIVIDKMASYVAKNGTNFETIVKSKGDPRFEFLNQKHEYHGYYKSKIKEFGTPEFEGKNKPKKVIAPVSFSIKKPKEDVPKEIKSALPVEESSSEDETKQEVSTTPPPPPPPPPIPPPPPPEEQPVEVTQTQNKNKLLDEDDPILEMIDLTEEVDEKKEGKRAEENKVKDKLAAAARELLASVNRDNKALQLERRKKAAAFLKLKSTEEGAATSATTIIKDEDETVARVKEKKKRKRNKGGESDVEDGEIKHRHKSKKKKSHKRKRSRSQKRLKKKRRRSGSCSSTRSSS